VQGVHNWHVGLWASVSGALTGFTNHVRSGLKIWEIKFPLVEGYVFGLTNLNRGSDCQATVRRTCTSPPGPLIGPWIRDQYSKTDLSIIG